MVLDWYVLLIVYLVSFALSASILFIIDWSKLISPRFNTDNWPIVLYLFCSLLAAFILGSFAIQIVEIGMGI